MAALRGPFYLVALCAVFATVRAEKSEKTAINLQASHEYPLFKQCDSRWGNWVMGGNGDTICQVGCLMSSISMAINGWGISIEGNVSNPGNLDIWLRGHGGFAPGTSDLEESVVPHINPNRIVWPSDGMHPKPDLTKEEVNHMLTKPHPRVVIANVLEARHFVLATSLSGDTLYVNDPGFNTASYAFSSVVGWRIFDMYN